MIYLKNNTETQAIYIPRQTVLGGGYIPSTKAYDKGYNDGLEVGKEQQKGKLSNLNVTENGQYKREDGWDVVNVDVPDLNGSYDEGYNQGKTDGIDEQKSKLESISITENGTYNKEDGYNHIEVNVPSYDQGQADMAAKARILNVTENGVYRSKFSDPIKPTVTGVYADGTDFYNYAQLGGKVFNTNITATSTTRLELWYKGDNALAGDAWNIIIGAEKNPDGSGYQIRYYIYSNSELIFELGQNNLRYTWDENAWHHILIAKEREDASYMSLWVDEVKIGDFGNRPFNPQSPFYINCIESFTDLTRNANGYFGMIKIDNTIIIPTANGFLNTNTGELLEVVKDGGYTFTENLPTYGEGELYKTINVNVPDLNGSYDEGKTDGINEQKSKLETINITENGTYNREDGYNKIIVKVPDLNGSYDEGYAQGQADIAENAKVLNVTENGVYKTKFSDPIMPTLVTGVYADGTEFYDYAYLEGISYDSGFMVSEDMEVEIWWKGDVSKTDKNLFGSQVDNNYAIFKIRIPDTAYRFDAEIAMRAVTYLNAESDRWYHFKMSYADGFWVDGVKIGDFSANISGTPYKLYINSNTPYSFNGVNGYFGMIKITTNGVENIITPTANGLLNTNTGELLEVVQDGTYTFTKNLPTYGEGEIYKTINVNVPDLNGSYDEGYAQGKTDGVNEQKSKLEAINITENGRYTKEDGYNEIVVDVPDLNGSYDEGYDQGQADVAAKARVLNVTENGVYKTKFSDPTPPTLVTGIYADGTNFYNYAQLNGKIFNTKIAPTIDSRLEFWYKGDNATNYWDAIIGSGNNDNKDCFQVRYWDNYNDRLLIEIGNSGVIHKNWDDTVWHHLIVSKAEGLWIDGEKKYDFKPSNTINGEFLINGVGYNADGTRNANGCFGMIKIDDVIIIPTANGFLNTNTGELLEVVKDGTYTFTENLPIHSEGELYKTINVNVPLVSCNLEDKWVTPSMNDRDSNGMIVVSPSEGYDGMKRTVINPKTIYNEGVEAGCQIEETKWVTPSINDVDVNGYIVVKPSEGYAAMGRVAINVSTIKSEWTTIGENSIKNYYWCPLTVSDGGIGERAKYFSLANEQTVYDENDVLIDRNNMFYLPTANNLNEFRLTKKAVKIVFPFKNEDAQHIGNLYLNDDVEQFACADKNLSSLSIIEVGINMSRFTLSNCNLLNLNKIVVHSNNNCNVTLTHNVKSTGTLYVNESNQFKNNWINALPSGWTVEYI